MVGFHLYPTGTDLITGIGAAPVGHFDTGRFFTITVFGMGVGDCGAAADIATTTGSREALVLIHAVSEQDNIAVAGSGADRIFAKQYPG